VNIPIRFSARVALAVGLSVITAEILRYPHSVRATLCASLVAGLPTFRRALMRQRFLLVWIGGLIGMAIETMFRDAPWFFLPAYFLLVVMLYRFASKSRDVATMTIVGYGLSGSLDNMFIDSANEPIFGGFYRALYCTVGLLAASLAFVILPIRKPPKGSRVPPRSYPMRDLVFLGFCACTAEWVGVLTSQYLTSSFIVLMSLTWGVQLCTIKDKTTMIWNGSLGILGLLVALMFDVAISFSTNDFGIYLAAFLTLIFSINWLKVKYPAMAPRLAIFVIITTAGTCMVPGPVHSFQQVLRVIYSMFTGILLSTILWFIDRSLRSVEAAVMEWGEETKSLPSGT
jgi:hypothetical protein